MVACLAWTLSGLLLLSGALFCGCSEESPSSPDPSQQDGGLDLDGAGNGGGSDGSGLGPDRAGSDGSQVHGNRPPVFDPVPDQEVPLGFSLSFRVIARDPERVPVSLAATELPAGALFDPVMATFSWTPVEGQLGEHLTRFAASDGERNAELLVGIRVFWPMQEDPDPEQPRPDPACEEGHAPCAGACCEQDELCLFNACVEPGEPCGSDSDCGHDEHCDPFTESCLPTGGGAGACVFIPPIGEFNPVVGCRWTPPEEQHAPNRKDVVMAPVVGNLNDDNDDGRTDLNDIPEIVFTSYNYSGAGCCNVPGTIRIVSGRCNEDGSMRTIASISEVDVDNSGGLAIGDLTRDGVPEIVGILIRNGQPQGTVVLERLGDDGGRWEVLWRNDQLPRWNRHTRGGAQPAMADINGDGAADVVIGNVVLNGLNGEVLWDGRQTTGGDGGIGNNAFLGPVSVVGDIDLDGKPEVAAGNTLYRFDGEPIWTFDFPSHNSPCGGDLPCDGFTAMGNFDEDEEGEVVIVRRGIIYILEHDGHLKWSVQIPKIDCGNNEGGPPTVADFDGDGRPEIGSAAADYYVVADPDCQGEPLPEGCDSEGILWKVRNEDCSSRVTASSVFDFEGDGQAEVVYGDETTLRIFRGVDGEILYEDAEHGSHTRLEEAIIADVDNDGNAEVVIAGNRYNHGLPGIRVYQDAADNWVRTRRIWNQHGYHVSNISELGRVPRVEEPNWLDPQLNNFRQNVQTSGLFNAPDLTVSLDAGTWECPMAFNFQITARNEGSLGLPAGVLISLYRGVEDDPAAELLHTLST